jgi:uncharacterized protein YjiS (DUF1127 family)
MNRAQSHSMPVWWQAISRAATAVTALSLTSRLTRAQALHRQRCALAALDDRLLADVGLTREQAEAEMNASLWDAPAHWRG